MATAEKKQAAKTDVSKKISISNELALGALIAELLGTFALTFALLNGSGSPFIAGIAVLIITLFLTRLSGAHINPAITIGQWATRQISIVKTVGYIVAQLLGAMLAMVIATKFIKGNIDPNTGVTAQLFSVKLAGTWKPFFGEFLGAIVFGLGVASVLFTKKEGFEAAFTVGGSLLLGAILAVSGSAGILNPAVALGLSAYSTKTAWALWVYGIGPILGMSGGMWLYKLLLNDVTTTAEKSK